MPFDPHSSCATQWNRYCYYSHFSDQKLRCRPLKAQGHTTGKWWNWDLNPICPVPRLLLKWMNKWLMGSWVLERKFYLQNLPCMSWVLTSKCLQCLDSAHRRDSVKAHSLPAAILWLCLPFMGSGIFESLILKISCNLLGALEDQPRQFRTAICLSASQEINQNPKAFSLFPQASTLETPSALLQLC